jgi:ATP/ADP translocase/HEAT repeat protein/CRP-like cAMP-binding protein
MFMYSFLAMTSYNILKPITRSKFIADLGADNLPYVLLGAGVLIGILMSGYAWLMYRLPKRWALPITQAGMVGMLVVFWFLFQGGQQWVSVAFYFVGLILGLLLISQFWTLANVVYDPRQAKRLFGFIGGGAPLGGIAGSAILTSYARQIGTTNLLLVSAVVLTACLAVTALILARERAATQEMGGAAPEEEKGVGAGEALRLLRGSKHLQIISLVISFAAIGAAIIEQQLNMAAEQAAQTSGGATDTNAITAFLGQVQLWTSVIGFVIQVWLISKIHRLLGIGFALMILPVSLGTTGLVMLIAGASALWAPGLARVADQSLRYTVDKTTREILFLPLPTDLKMKAKPFVDVTVDRFSKGLGALLLLILIKPWGFGLSAERWPLLSYASLTVTALWIFMALRARRGYLAAFRRSIERRDLQPAQMRLNVADLSTVETLIEEMASPDERRVLYAMDVLESLEKRNLITPLLLYHESPAVRARALGALAVARPDVAEQWVPQIRRMIADPNTDVRAAAVRALATVRNEQAADLVRPYLDDKDPRIVLTAASVLGRSSKPDDLAMSERALTELAGDTRESSAAIRRDVAAAIRDLPPEHFRHLLVPLLYDPNPQVAREAMASVKSLGVSDFIFVPTLVSLLRNTSLKRGARDVLVGYGEPVLDALAHFLRSPEEDIWVRRHLPSTIARIPTQRSMDILVDALAEPDGFLRYKVVAAIERLRREHPEFTFAKEPIEKLALKEALRYYNYLSLHYNLFDRAGFEKDSLLARALEEKTRRTHDRIYKLLSLIFPWKDIAAARWALERGDPRARASAAEYLDNILAGPIRRQVLPILEELPREEKVRRGNVFLRTRPRDAEETLLQLINDEDPVVAAAAIDLVRTRRLWALADDIEYVLAHRDAKDWDVFEAASWALAAQRLPEEKRRSAWLEPLPSVELADRLRRLPLFGSVWVDELFRIAGRGRQVRHEAGRVLYQEGRTPDSLQFLLDGRLVGQARSGGNHDILPPSPIAVEEVLQGAPMSETIRTLELSVCLNLTAEEFQSLFADNIELAGGLFQMLIGQSPADAHRLVLQGQAADVVNSLAAGGLKPIEKVLVLQRIPAFSRTGSEELLELAALADEMKLEQGKSLFGAADPAAIWIVLSGAISLEASGDAPLTAGPGDTIGIYETLAGVAIGREGKVTAGGAALRIDREELFDLLSQRSNMLAPIFSALFDAVEAA